MKYLSIILILFLSLFANEKKYKYTGFASEMETGNKIYFELHKEVYSNKSIIENRTLYLTHNKDTLAVRNMFFSKDSTKPKFELIDNRTGYLEAAKSLTNNLVEVRTRENSSEETEVDTLEIPGNYVIDGGLTFFFRENWNKLLNNEEIEFYFIAPAKLDYFEFVVYSTGFQTVNGIKGLKLRIEISNWFLNNFVDPIDIVYSLETKEILFYEGISNINNSDGDNYDVIIDYTIKPGIETWKN